LAPRNIRVNAISPGYVLTEGVKAAGMPGSPTEQQAIAMTPLGRAGLPEDIALPAAFLASDDARFITGEILSVTGGAGM
jgi:3-oxoacyl-[acyl-carrier protein] reductase